MVRRNLQLRFPYLETRPVFLKYYCSTLQPRLDAQKLKLNIKQFVQSSTSNQKDNLLSKDKLKALCELATTESGRLLVIYLFIYLAFSLSGEGHCYRFPQLQQALLYRFVVEEVTVHNTGSMFQAKWERSRDGTESKI